MRVVARNFREEKIEGRKEGIKENKGVSYGDQWDKKVGLWTQSRNGF